VSSSGWVGRRVYAATGPRGSSSGGAGVGGVVVEQGRTHLPISKYARERGRTRTQPGPCSADCDINGDGIGEKIIVSGSDSSECGLKRGGDPNGVGRDYIQGLGWGGQHGRSHPRQQQRPEAPARAPDGPSSFLHNQNP